MIIDFFQSRDASGQRNRGMVLSEILLNGPISRSAIAKRLSMTTASVSRITRQLIDTGLVREGEALDATGPGRRFIGLEIRPSSCFVAGISINAFRQDIAIADLGNATVSRRVVSCDALDDAPQTLDVMAAATREMIADAGVASGRVIACGAIITGAVDPQLGKVHHAPLIDWENIDVGAVLRQQLQIPVFVENIPNAKMLMTQMFGAARGVENVALINVSLAIGASFMLNGRLIRGRQQQSGLLGSLPVNAMGTTRALDECASGAAVVADLGVDVPARRLPKELLRIIDAGRDGDAAASQALYRAGSWLAQAVASIDAMHHPDIILVSGPLTAAQLLTGYESQTRATE
ncbi:MAG: ROK family transcriptional regulator, partial [Pseudomonadota bacterium]